MFCGRPFDELHHGTGRDHEGQYLDRMLVMPSDHDCHVFAHDDWRHEKLDELDGPHTAVEYVAIRLRRIAMNLGRIDQHSGRQTFWGLLADAMVSWAEELDAHVRALDERDPTWRNDGRFPQH